jgi:hypothetical protein
MNQLLKALICFFASSHALSYECKEASWSNIKDWQKGKGSTDVVFFASWCSSCKDQLKKDHKGNVIFISIFDEKSDSERVLNFFRPEATCYFSKEIEKELKIKSLPKTLNIIF